MVLYAKYAINTLKNEKKLKISNLYIDNKSQIIDLVSIFINSHNMASKTNTMQQTPSKSDINLKLFLLNFFNVYPKANAFLLYDFFSYCCF